MKLTISSRPVELVLEHSSHHHHEADVHHSNHEHTFDQRIDWQIIRVQNQRSLTFDDLYLLSSSSLTQLNNLEITFLDFEEFPYSGSNYHYSSIIRGPPPTG